MDVGAAGMNDRAASGSRDRPTGAVDGVGRQEALGAEDIGHSDGEFGAQLGFASP